MSSHASDLILDADDLSLVRRLEMAARHSWPAAIERELPEGCWRERWRTVCWGGRARPS